MVERCWKEVLNRWNIPGWITGREWRQRSQSESSYDNLKEPELVWLQWEFVHF